jgi:undecaprenyl-diphosphatase
VLRGGRSRSRRALTEFDTIDRAVYLAVASALTATLDAWLIRLCNAANHSRLWLATAAGLAILGGRRHRRAAVLGVAAIGLTSATTNLVVKPVLRRGRPDRVGAAVPEARHVRMPISHSFPSGHAASASASATAVGHELPVTALPLRLLAVGVAYSRVHTGVRYPSDVVAGSVIGTLCGTVIGAVAARMARG